jgi:hypothetical protein
MKSFKKNVLYVLMAVLTGYSCENEKKADTPEPGMDYSNGVFVINEGKFAEGTGTITHFRREDMMITQNLFQEINNQQLGNIAQSMNQIGTRGFIVVNNANIIWIVTMKNFKIMAAINSVNLPRYLVDAGEGKAYVSSWDNIVAVVDYLSLEKTGEIPTGTGPEKMLRVGEYTWVLNQGGFGLDSTITIIDNTKHAVDRTLQVYPRPTGIQKDINGNVWVICSGRGWNGFPTPSDSEGHLLCVNPVNDQILHDLVFPDTDKHPEKLVINHYGDVLFYVLPDGVYRHDISSDILETTPVVSKSGIYSIGYDPVDEVIFVADPVDFNQDGWIYRYNPDTGELISSHKAGIGPAEFYFAN